MKRALILLVLSYCATAADVAAQQASLTDQQIQDAIAVGLKAKGKEQGFDLQDKGQAMNAALFGGNSGFRLVMYTPTTWIRQLASQAAKQYRPFTRENVTDEVIEPVLRVIVHPDTPDHVTAAGSAVEHAVLRDTNKTTSVQPIYIEPFAEEISNGFGAKRSFQGLQVKFPLDALKELRGAKGDSEFILTVIGQGHREKNFEIKRGHFLRIP